MRVERFVAVVAMMIMGQSAAADSYGVPTRDPNPGDVKVDFVRSVKLHARGDVMDACQAGFAVRGCTQFPSEVLTCHCELQDGGWVMSTSARVQADMHVPNNAEYQSVVAHEQRHLADLEYGLRKHLKALASFGYQSEKTCRRMAKFYSVSPHLRVVMNRLRTESNAKFGCSRGQH